VGEIKRPRIGKKGNFKRKLYPPGERGSRGTELDVCNIGGWRASEKNVQRDREGDRAITKL